MSCNCTQAGTLLRCGTTANIGTIADTLESVLVAIRNVATGRLTHQAQTSGAAGEITLDLTDPDSNFYYEDQQYEIWVSKVSSANLYDKEDLTINSVIDDCFYIEFINDYDSAGDLQTIATQTL